MPLSQFLRVLLTLLLISSVSHAQPTQCSDLFTLEASSPSHSATEALLELQILIAKGKDAVRSQKWSDGDKRAFQRILLLKEVDMQSLETRQLLDLYSLFARWNLMAPPEFQNRLFNTLQGRLSSWSAKDYLSFAISRKITPAPLPEKFSQLIKTQILQKLTSWDLNTQLEVLGAEIFQQSKYTIKEMNILLSQVTASLADSSQILRLKPVKELYRALLLLRATEPTVFYIPILKLEQQLEKQMQAQSLTFNEDGTSGADNAPVTTTLKRILFEARLDELFRGEAKISEYSNPALLGFYDPVDILYPRIQLVVEWDGRHHYFRNVSLEADTATGAEQLVFRGNVLRPIDQVRDRILRRQGYRILRISMQMNEQLETMDIMQLFQEQNP
jgi:very-short-patch-repair endonuclease